MKKKQIFEICAICGAVAEKGSAKKEFRCAKCGSRVSVVLGRALFAKIAKKVGKR